MATKNDPAAAEAPDSFEALMARLESLVVKLERGELPLEDSLRAYEEGIGLVRRAQGRLDSMDRRLEQLQHDGTRAPLDADAMKATAADRPAARRAPAPPVAAPPAEQDADKDGARDVNVGLYEDDLPF
jgi:exodeoxyribonuclease VII small subunit